MKLNFQKLNGLVPAIIQDAQTNKVLMLGFMNQAALDQTLREKRVTFYSRSKKKLWTKGATSGNFLDVINIKADCDQDALLIKVKPRGPTCHLDRYSCFNDQTDDNLAFLSDLYKLIENRRKNMPDGSYTAHLFKQGLSKINKKIIEEAAEITQAATSEGKKRTIEEISDFLYHLMVLMVEQGIIWNNVSDCLRERSG